MPNLWEDFLALEPQITDPETEKLAFLDRGYASSNWCHEIHLFRNRLRTTQINNYPPPGTIPFIDLDFLSFLHPEVTEACLCVIDQENYCHWFGRHPTDRGQMWSGTKFIPIYYLLSQIKTEELPSNWLVTDRENPSQSFEFSFLIDLIFTYADRGLSSNSLALLFKNFFAPQDLEHWLHSLTGNYGTVLGGGYGEESCLIRPVLTTKTGTTLLSNYFSHQGENLVSAYDLTRCLSQLAWQEPSDRYDTLITAMAKDSARYLDVALAHRSLLSLSEVVILSKMGFGRSKQRHRSELVYTVLLNSQELSFCLTLRTALGLDHPAQEARYLDARMATEVTNTIERFVLG